jgi:hypothetical protein
MRPCLKADVELQVQSGLALVVQHEGSLLCLERSGGIVLWNAGYLVSTTLHV